MDILLSNDEIINIPEKVFRNIRNLKSIGRGSFGEVFEYIDGDSKLSFAIKHISIPTDNLLSSHVRREIEINRKVSHDHVVRFYNFFHLPNHSVSFIMEYMEGGSLKRRLNELEAEQGNISGTTRMENSEILRISYEVAKGLQYLHNMDIVHRDLRSANILLTDEDRCKIGDFGISAEINVLALKSGFSTMGVGNSYWQAPEMVVVDFDDSESEDEEDEDEDKKSQTRKKDAAEGKSPEDQREKDAEHKPNKMVDIWSLGILILEMIHNVPPYMKKPLCAYVDRIMRKKKAPVTPSFASPAVKELLGKCLKMNPDHRSSAAEIIEFLRGVYTPLEFDLFLSHNWGKDNSNHDKVAVINNHLRLRGYRTWFDEEEMRPSTFTENAMSRGISNSKVFVLFLTKDYMVKVNGRAARGVLDNCFLEFKYAVLKRTPVNMLTVVLEPEMLDEKKWQETFAMHMSKRIYLDMCEDINNDDAFQKKLDILCESVDLMIQRQIGSAPLKTGQRGNDTKKKQTSKEVEEGRKLLPPPLPPRQPAPPAPLRPRPQPRSQPRVESNTRKLAEFEEQQKRKQQQQDAQKHEREEKKHTPKNDLQKPEKGEDKRRVQGEVTLELLKGCGGTPPQPRRSHIALYDKGRNSLYVFGGYDYPTYFNDLHVFNISTSTWSSIPTKGTRPTLTRAAGGWLCGDDMFVFGGFGFGGHRSNSLHTCGLTTGEWRCVEGRGSVPSPRERFVVWNHQQYTVLFGGYGDEPTDLTQGEECIGYTNNQLFLLDTSTSPPQWSKPQDTGPRPSPRSSSAYCSTTNTGYLFGGHNNTQRHLNDLYSLDLHLFTWRRITTTGGVPSERNVSAMCCIGADHLFICGGWDSGDARSDCYLINLSSNIWREVQVPNFKPTDSHTITTVDNENVLLFGGLDKKYKPTNIFGLFQFN